jgi:hypothetical protein
MKAMRVPSGLRAGERSTARGGRRGKNEVCPNLYTRGMRKPWLSGLVLFWVLSGGWNNLELAAGDVLDEAWVEKEYGISDWVSHATDVTVGSPEKRRNERRNRDRLKEILDERSREGRRGRPERAEKKARATPNSWSSSPPSRCSSCSSPASFRTAYASS